ncbi:MAG: nucleotide-binding protein [Pseudomonadota bacterium]
MKKYKLYPSTRFTADVLRDAMQVTRDRAERTKEELNRVHLKVEHEDSTWSYDTVDEFFADFRKYSGYAIFSVDWVKFFLSVTSTSRETVVEMEAPTRGDIEAVFEIFEKYAEISKLPSKPPPVTPMPTVFIGHGRNQAWRDLKDHLHDKHGVPIHAFETGARAGHTIRDILEDLVGKSSFAILVMTGEDEQADGTLRARQNVIHEAGLFQGRLGFARAILLLEEGVDEFSNVAGVQYIRFSKGNIKETFGEVLATLRREFPQPA